MTPATKKTVEEGIVEAWNFHANLAGQCIQQWEMDPEMSLCSTPMEAEAEERENSQLLNECWTSRLESPESSVSGSLDGSQVQVEILNSGTGSLRGTITQPTSLQYSKTTSKKSPKSHIILSNLKLAPRGRGIYKESYFLNAPEVLEELENWPAVKPIGKQCAAQRMRPSGMWRRRPQQTGELDLASYLLARDAAVEGTAKALVAISEQLVLLLKEAAESVQFLRSTHPRFCGTMEASNVPLACTPKNVTEKPEFFGIMGERAPEKVSKRKPLLSQREKLMNRAMTMSITKTQRRSGGVVIINKPPL